MATETTKQWYESKTLWANIFALIGSLALLFFDISAEEWATITAFGLGVVNIILRLITSKAITWGSTTEETQTTENNS